MQIQKINRLTGTVSILLSLTALVSVLSGYFQAAQNDEGSAAHIFQFSVVLLVPAILGFLMTADWKQPFRSARILAIPIVALALAFGALFYLEHYWY